MERAVQGNGHAAVDRWFKAAPVGGCLCFAAGRLCSLLTKGLDSYIIQLHKWHASAYQIDLLD